MKNADVELSGCLEKQVSQGNWRNLHFTISMQFAVQISQEKNLFGGFVKIAQPFIEFPHFLIHFRDFGSKNALTTPDSQTSSHDYKNSNKLVHPLELN